MSINSAVKPRQRKTKSREQVLGESTSANHGQANAPKTYISGDELVDVHDVDVVHEGPLEDSDPALVHLHTDSEDNNRVSTLTQRGRRLTNIN